MQKSKPTELVTKQEEQLELALSMIVKDSESPEIVRRAIESVEEWVHGIFITVTHKKERPQGSLLLDLLKEKKAKVSFWKWNNRFDDARNFAISQIPRDKFLYYVWMDADDVWLNPENLPKMVKEAYIYNWAAIFFDYLYAVDLDEKGRIREVIIIHKRERVIKNDNSLKWAGKLHETLIDQQAHNVVKVFKDDCKVVHLTTDARTTQNLNRNIEILELAIQAEQRKDPRTIVYLGKAYFDRAKMYSKEKEVERMNDFQLAELLLLEYLKGKGTPGIDYHGGSGFREERATAWEYLGEIFRYRKEYNRAIKATLNALLEAPEFPNYWVDMALTYLLMNDIGKAQIWLDQSKYVKIPDTTIILGPRDLKVRALQVDYQIALDKKELERAKTSLGKLLSIYPDNTEYKDLLYRVNTARTINKVAQSIVYLGRYLEGQGQKDKVLALVQAVPYELNEEPFVAEMRHKFLPARVHKDNEISIICGPGFEKWSPKSIEKGIGGSESAVIFLSKELAKLGYKVTVYANPEDDAGKYEGVNYVPWYELNIKDSFNILILWRAIGFADTPFIAKKTYLWTHDVPSNPDFTEKRLSKINKIFSLSNYHQSLFKMMDNNGNFVDIPEQKMMVTANGIPEFPIDLSIKREPHRMIYASSYDRGLANLLVIWPKIKEKVPDAELHIFYGWVLFDSFYRDNPERMAWKAKMKEMMRQPGIFEHGRISQPELIKEFQKAGIFTYPTDFQEISCQNAMFAQKYGAIPVTTDFAALSETVKYGKKVNTDITCNEGKEEYTQVLIDALTNTQWQKEERTRMMEGIKDDFKWETIAKQWIELFKQNERT